MITKHLSEEAIQWYAMHGNAEPGVQAGAEKELQAGPEEGTQTQEYLERDADIIAHMLTCGSCQARATEYQSLFAAIGQQPAPLFDFDLAAAVLSQLPATLPAKPGSARPGNSAMTWLIPLIVIGAAGIPGYIFRKNILGLFSGISSMLIYLAMITAVSVVVFQGMETYKKYQRKIDALNLY
ncbi:MAG TPA: hypothetical protein VE035_17020 [Puia sp.]|nr:hypothetical protein [Puia sp.]